MMMPEKIKLAAQLLKSRDPDLTIDSVCQTLGVSRSTLYRYVGPDREVRAK